MSREYTITASNLTLANQPVTLIGLRPGTTCALEILRMWVAQSASVVSAQQRIEWGTQVSAFPTVTGATPVKLKTGDPISQIVSGTGLAAGTCGVNASAEGGGAKSPMGAASFNVVGEGYTWLPTPDETIILSPGLASSFYFFLPVAATTLTGWDVGMTFKELG